MCVIIFCHQEEMSGCAAVQHSVGCSSTACLTELKNVTLGFETSLTTEWCNSYDITSGAPVRHPSDRLPLF
jgi:hypothetical protein